MQVTETRNENLSREYKVVLNAAEIERKIETRLKEVGRTVKRNGFRPGKVPLPVLKREYGKTVRGEVLERAVQDGANQAIAEKGIRPAARPTIEIMTYDEGSDLEFTVAVDVMPDFGDVDYGALRLEKLVPEISDGDVDSAVERLANDQRETETVEEIRPAAVGDTVVIDFIGRIDGEIFDGGVAEDYSLELGSDTFIPGFEDQLVGALAGDKKDLTLSFPDKDGPEHLRGKEVVFEVTVKELRAPKPLIIDGAMAEGFGFESLDALKDHMRAQMEREYGLVSRARLKRSLLDALAEQYQFEVPDTLVVREFDSIWSRLEEEMQHNTDEKPGKLGKEMREEYKAIALRRVRLGLLLSDIGQKNAIDVSNEDVNRAVMEKVRSHPNQERQIIEFYRQNEEALASLRAPIFEDKVVDFILELAKPTEKSVSVEELLRDLDVAAETETGKSDAAAS